MFYCQKGPAPFEFKTPWGREPATCRVASECSYSLGDVQPLERHLEVLDGEPLGVHLPAQCVQSLLCGSAFLFRQGLTIVLSQVRRRQPTDAQRVA